MRVGIIVAFIDYNRKGGFNRGALQPQIGTLIAGMLPQEVEIEVINETWERVDWNRSYDLLFITCMHSDFDRARQISHYWRRRGAKTVFGGTFASTYPHLCQPYFDAVVVGDAEVAVRQIYRDFCRGELQPFYVSDAYSADRVPVPRFDLLARKQSIPLSFEVTRGCPFTCEFCTMTAIGTRYHVRPVETVVRDIEEARRMLRGLVPDYKLKIAMLYDNNIGGNISYMRQFCEAIRPLDLRWAAAITFNVITNPENIRALSSAGCRFLFTGLESFNPEAIADMHKYQNSINETRRVIEQCREQGIVLGAGLLISSSTDGVDYIKSIPQRLKESGLYIPSFIAFECPFPGTPYFHRLASEEEPAFLPNAMLYDFAGYSLVVKPKRAPVESFIEAYKQTLAETFTTRAKLSQVIDSVPSLLAKGYWDAALMSLLHPLSAVYRRPHPERTYIPGTDVVPPELNSVPLTDDDFENDEERRTIVEPWQVTDSEGRVLPMWQQPVKVFVSKGRISATASQIGKEKITTKTQRTQRSEKIFSLQW